MDSREVGRFVLVWDDRRVVPVYVMRAVRWLSQWSGLPAFLVSGLAVVVGFRLLRKTLRLLVEVAIVSAILFAATAFGWIEW